MPSLLIHLVPRALVRLSCMILVTLLGAGLFRAEAASSYRTALLGVISELQALASGTHTEAEWTERMEKLDAIYTAALADGDRDMAIRARVVKARALSESLGRHDAALAELAAIRKDMASDQLPDAFRGVFLEEAAIHGRTGDEAKVLDVMEAYRNSSLYDPETYPILGGSGPSDPLVVVRPSAPDSDSATMTALKVQQRRATSIPGELFPEFDVTDEAGNRHTLHDYEGQVLLVDFWIESWSSWRAALPQLMSTYETYAGGGFSILGFGLAPGDAKASRRFLRKEKVPWPVVFGERDLGRDLGLIGTVGNVLVGPDGRIVGRDLYGAALDQAVARLLDDE